MEKLLVRYHYKSARLLLHCDSTACTFHIKNMINDHLYQGLLVTQWALNTSIKTRLCRHKSECQKFSLLASRQGKIL